MNVRFLIAGAALLAVAACSSHPTEPGATPSAPRADGTPGGPPGSPPPPPDTVVTTFSNDAGGQLGSGNDQGAGIVVGAKAPTS